MGMVGICAHPVTKITKLTSIMFFIREFSYFWHDILYVNQASNMINIVYQLIFM